MRLISAASLVRVQSPPPSKDITWRNTRGYFYYFKVYLWSASSVTPFRYTQVRLTMKIPCKSPSYLVRNPYSYPPLTRFYESSVCEFVSRQDLLDGAKNSFSPNAWPGGSIILENSFIGSAFPWLLNGIYFIVNSGLRIEMNSIHTRKMQKIAFILHEHLKYCQAISR